MKLLRRREAAPDIMALALSDWLDRLQSQHPVEIDLGLERVAQVAGGLDLLRPEAKTFTVAGTNGKGSVVEVLSCCWQPRG